MTGQTPFDRVLEKIRKESKSTVELGTKFERLVFDFFEADSVYTKRFEKVWMWADWARENNIKEKSGTAHDLGIDIVARERGGTLCAIQCKCYDDDTVLDKGGVDSFIAAGRTYKMDNYILASTGPVNSNAMAMLRGIRCNIITKEHLRNGSVDWSQYPKIQAKKPRPLYDYQHAAVDDVVRGFQDNSRGKLIMACGTGKTRVSLQIAEDIVGIGGTVLYLVPSISLILQSMREWSDNSTKPHYYMAVCSDKSVRNIEDGTMTELETPASTDPKELSVKMAKRSKDTLNVIFSTYHSIEVVMKSVNERLDLILCDEAHRTTGIESNTKESFLSMVHHERNIRAKRRLYMTATPRIYTDTVKNKAQQKEKEVISMDDKAIYGPEFHKLSFYDAVHKYHALTDFKVRIAIMDGDTMDKWLQKSTADDDKQIPLNEKTLMASVWHALEYPGAGDSKKLLQRVIVFCDMINSSKLFAGDELDYKKDIKENAEKFARAQEVDRHRSFAMLVEHIKSVKGDRDSTRPDIRHVDGGDNAQSRRRELDWLRDSADDPNTCRILSNARCLSEGVDVPALDGVVFLNPRKSVVDVVQAVGRVMRRSPNKEYGYVVLPVAIPAGVSIDDALKGNKHFAVVWKVLNALRSHDGKLGDEINRLILEPPPIGTNNITNRIIIRHAGSHNLGRLDMPVDKMIRGISTKLVEKVGDIDYYDKYGKKLGETTHIIEARIKNKIAADKSIKREIQKFHEGLRVMINDSVTEESAIQAISQHMVMFRVFDALFSGQFTSHNPISVAFNGIISKIGLEGELDELEGFYADVKKEAALVDTPAKRQNFIKKIYGNFFESADKKGTEQHGIVYTPIEIVDFIINSIQHILKKEFYMSFNDRQVKVLEPFAGTGSFLVRLLESDHIKTNLYEKYKHDLFANELILLAYYIATINIETAYSNIRKSGKYVPFDGISYTDTLQIDPQYREGDRHRMQDTKLLGDFKQAHQRIRHQRGSHLHVLMGNPPYSVGQKDASENNPNITYPKIDKRIQNTYKLNTKTIRVTPLYDSYIRSIRWASDRIGESGIIGFVTNASFLRTESTAGVRACLEEEFTDVWCFDLRGNQRTQGETSKREGGKIFGSGSRAPVAITILVKNPKKKKCTIHYKDIGDYLDREQKLETVKDVNSITGIKGWKNIIADDHYDWIDQRNSSFTKYRPIGNKYTKYGQNSNSIFKIFSLGTSTNRDVWVYNTSTNILIKNMKKHVEYYNKLDPSNPKTDTMSGKLTRGLKQKLKKQKVGFDKNKIRISLYRPFLKQYLYFDKTRVFNEDVHLMPQFFPENHSKNLIICLPDKGKSGMFSVIITDVTPDLHIIEQSQCFPLYVYENGKDKKLNIMDSTLDEYKKHYNDKKITKKDIFYYIYGLLHHEGYKSKFANNLSRELPHIPMATDFWKFSNTGEKLVNLHLNYETCSRYNLGKPKAKFGKLEKMAYPRVQKDGKQVADKTKLRINGVEVYDNIPPVNYQVNGRTPLEWIIDRYKLTTDNDSGITNDPTEGITESKTITLVERMVYIGVESDKIVKELSKLPFEPKNWTPKKTGLDVHIN